MKRTIKKLNAMPYAQAHIEIIDDTATCSVIQLLQQACVQMMTANGLGATVYTL